MQLPPIDNIAFSSDGHAVRILDQTLLPGETRYLELSKLESLYEAIYSLRVRGAPAIGIFGAFSLAVLVKNATFEDSEALLDALSLWHARLLSSRPTAVNLSKMLDRMVQCAQKHSSKDVGFITTALTQEALLIQQEDATMCKAIATHGLSLLKHGMCVLTHCNAGPLATSRYGTALGPLFLAKEQGMEIHAYCDETRPLLQGARLTTYELNRAGISCTLICDNMASFVMQQNKVQACLVGCDRIARNGDTANKIGTSGLAILARYYGIPFYVLGPSSTIDFSCPDATQIPIELRDEREIKDLFFARPSAPETVSCYNPAFDITPGDLISAIITERGICYPPFSQSLAALFPEEYDSSTDR